MWEDIQRYIWRTDLIETLIQPDQVAEYKRQK